MAEIDSSNLQAVTFLRDGYQDQYQVHMAGTWTLMPASLATMSPEDQVAELGAHYWNPGAAQDAFPAEAVGNGPGADQLITVADAAAVLNRSEQWIRVLIQDGRLPYAQRAGDSPRAPYLLSQRVVHNLHRNPERAAQVFGEARPGRHEITSHFDGIREREPADSTRGYAPDGAVVIPLPTGSAEDRR